MFVIDENYILGDSDNAPKDQGRVWFTHSLKRNCKCLKKTGTIQNLPKAHQTQDIECLDLINIEALTSYEVLVILVLFGKGKYTYELWQIHFKILTNPCQSLDKSRLQLWPILHWQHGFFFLQASKTCFVVASLHIHEILSSNSLIFTQWGHSSQASETLVT